MKSNYRINALARNKWIRMAVFGCLLAFHLHIYATMNDFPSGAGFLFVEDESKPVFEVSNGTAAVTPGPARWGDRALQWEWEPGGGRLAVEAPIHFRFRDPDSVSNALSTFMVWIHNPAPRSDKLRVNFRRGDGPVDAWFEYGLDFSGWRACWVPFERDMQGTPHPDMDTIEFVTEGPAGSLRFDMLVASTWLDSRHAAPDFQQPFVFDPERRGEVLGFWDGLMDFHVWERSALADDGGEPLPREVLEGLASRLEKAVGMEARPTRSMDSMKARYADWFPEGETAYPVFYPSQRPHLGALGITPERVMRDLGRLLEDIGLAWRRSEDAAERKRLAAMALRIWNHVRDEGWEVGSGLGALHHLGYSMREMYRGMFYLRDLWEAEEELEAVSAWVRWYAGTGMIYRPENVRRSIDNLNTQSQGMLIGLILQPAVPAMSFAAFRDWVAHVLEPSPGIVSIFKTDGSVFHHRGHYPAYANGGFEGFSPLIFTLADSPFAVREPAYGTLRKALLTHRFAANHTQWPLSIAGRHPTGQWAVQAEPFYWIGMGGPDGMDEALLTAYLRLAPESERRLVLEEKGIKPEPEPQGFRFLPYAGLALHRYGPALLSLRGFSRYLWSHETYRGANHYGRYLAHGFLEVLHRGDPVTHAASGFKPEGWDWNRLPGTTTRVLPWEKLRADILNLDRHSGFEEMLLSTEPVLGGLAWDESTGLFAQSIRGHAKYDDELTARKSVFFAGGRLVAVGSGISDPGETFPVETTLWQVAGEPEADAVNEDSAAQTVEGVYAVESPHGIGYILFGDTVWRRSRGWQESPDQRTDAPTRGYFDTAVIEHGVGPANAAYRYGMDFSGDPASLADWAEREENGSPWVKFHRACETMHHIEFTDHGLHGMSVFAPSVDLGHEVFLSADHPVLIWSQEEASGSLRVRLADPDLRLYEIDGDQFDGLGVQREVSIYSRPWAYNPSQGAWIELRLRGRWTADAGDCYELHPISGGDTLLRFKRAESQPVTVNLEPLK